MFALLLFLVRFIYAKYFLTISCSVLYLFYQNYSVAACKVRESSIGPWSRLIPALVKSPIRINEILFVWTEDGLSDVFVSGIEVFVQIVLHMVFCCWRRLKLCRSETVVSFWYRALWLVSDGWVADTSSNDTRCVVEAWSRLWCFSFEAIDFHVKFLTKGVLRHTKF